MERHYSIGELADAAGFSRRTIRFYVQRGVIAPPLGAGRGHYYTEDHLNSLRRVRALQERGHSLEAVSLVLKGRAPGEVRAELEALEAEVVPETWAKVELLPGLELHAECGRHRLTPAKIRQLRAAAAEVLGLKAAKDNCRKEEP